MKTLINIILFIPKMIINVVWNLFWGLVKTALILAIIFFGLIYYANNISSQLATNISNAFNNISNYFEKTNSQDLTKAISELSSDDFTYYAGARWSTNSATVYISTTNSTLVNAYETAISNWNATGAFTFTLVGDATSADIVASDYSDATSKAAGLAETETNAVTNHITHVDVKLNTYYLIENNYGYTFDRIVNTAEHELGHAIGLNHDDSETSVMQSSGSYYGIQDADIAAVLALYTN